MSFSAPKPPDPYQTAAAQRQANQGSMQDAAKYNDVNQINPYGSMTYSGSYDDGSRTQTTSVSPEAQAYIDSQVGYSQDSANAARDRINSLTGQPFSLQGIGLAGGDYANGGYTPITDNFSKGGQIQYGIENAGPIKRGLGPSGPIQTSVGGADAGTRNNVEDALYQRATSRLDPQFQQGQSDLQTRLANQGITQGSDAYDREMSNFGMTKNDAYAGARNDAIAQGGAEQSRLFGLELSQGQFANSAQSQGFGQQLDRGNFTNSAQGQQFAQNAAQQQAYNSAAGQDFAQNMGAAGFSNDANMAKFGQTQTLRNQGIQEALLQRNQPINEAAAIMGQAPGVQAPQFGGPAQYSPQGVPIGDYIQQNYQTQSQNRNSLISALTGMAGMGGAAYIMRPR